MPTGDQHDCIEASSTVVCLTRNKAHGQRTPKPLDLPCGGQSSSRTNPGHAGHYVQIGKDSIPYGVWVVEVGV